LNQFRKLKFEGEIYTYIRKLSQVVFGFLKSTCTWYKMSFDETNLSSGKYFSRIIDKINKFKI